MESRCKCLFYISLIPSIVASEIIHRNKHYSPKEAYSHFQYLASRDKVTFACRQAEGYWEDGHGKQNRAAHHLPEVEVRAVKLLLEASCSRLKMRGN